MDDLSIHIRAPGTSPVSFEPPPLDWLSGTWHVTHSTLPLWKTKRNVRITYTVLPPASNQSSHRLDDVVSYQTLNDPKLKTVHGVDTAIDTSTGAWVWRGKGLLMVASSQWEVLGHGEVQGEQWAVTYFAKTLFTPSGLDVYSRAKDGLSEDLVMRIKASLSEVDDPNIRRLTSEIFEVARDGTRSD